MKKLLKISLLLCGAALYSQSISDFKFIQIKSASSDFEGNKFGITDLLQSRLTAKKYAVINADQNTWPEEAKNNPCNVVNAEVLNTSTFLKNKIRIDFKDCNNKTIASSEGKTNIKEFEAGYREALTSALSTLQNSNPVEQNAVKKIEVGQSKQQPEVITKKEEAPKNTEVELKQTATAKAQTFSNGLINLNRIIISENQFILADPENSMPFAVFNASTKKDVYHVKLQDATQTLGYFENGDVVIEMKNNTDGTYRKEVFRAK